jgi:hypothetical protein
MSEENVDGHIGCIVIRPDGRVLPRAVPDPLAKQKRD